MKSDALKRDLRFAIIPKVVHPWFEEVYRGAIAQAELLEEHLGIKIEVEYLAPETADLAVQQAIFDKAIASGYDGIAIDPLDKLFNMKSITDIKNKGIPVIVFDSPAPVAGILSVGNNFTQQGTVAAERLVKLLGEKGKVAVMQGYPSAPNHNERYVSQMAVLKKCPGIEIVDGGIDNDDIEVAKEQALSVLNAHPDLDGYLCCDASGPIGIAAAIKEANKAGKVKVVSMDGIKPILLAIKEGIIESSVATIPRMQGSLSILMLWQASLGVQMPRKIDTNIDIITQENVDSFLALAV
jgi:ribose transport system substrate-binding protein